MLGVLTVNAQKDSTKALNAVQPVFMFVEQMPEFPGGENALRTFLGQNIRYPEAEASQNIQGRVIIRFVVTQDGSIDSVTVLRGVSAGLDKEAVRVVKMLPKFKPGMQQGKRVMVYYNLPIVFKLSDEVKPLSAFDTKMNTDENFKSGVALMKQNEFKKAVKFFDQSIKKFPHDYYGFQYRGNCEFKLGKTKQAKEDYEKAKTLGAKDVYEYFE